MSAGRIRPHDWPLVERLRAAGIYVPGDQVRSSAMRVSLLSGVPNLVPLEAGTGIVLPLEITASAPVRIRGFALSASWLAQGGTWAPYRPDISGFELRGRAGAPLRWARERVLTWLCQWITLQPLQPVHGYLLAEVKDEVAPTASDLRVTLTVEVSSGRTCSFWLGPLCQRAGAR